MKRKIMKHTVSSTIKGRALVNEVSSSDNNMIKRAYSPPKFVPVNPSQAKDVILRPIIYEPDNGPIQLS